MLQVHFLLGQLLQQPLAFGRLRRHAVRAGLHLSPLGPESESRSNRRAGAEAMQHVGQHRSGSERPPKRIVCTSNSSSNHTLHNDENMQPCSCT